jgi:hypothetical protein
MKAKVMTTESQDETSQIPNANLVSPEVLAKTGTSVAQLPRVKWAESEPEEYEEIHPSGSAGSESGKSQATPDQPQIQPREKPQSGQIQRQVGKKKAPKNFSFDRVASIPEPDPNSTAEGSKGSEKSDDY